MFLDKYTFIPVLKYRRDGLSLRIIYTALSLS